jgi:membrane protease YdiL (CAAX protease family)
MGRSVWWLPWAVYGPLAALGAALAWFLHGQVLRAPPGPRFLADGQLAQLVGMALALLVTWVTLGTTRWLVTHTRWARTLHGTLRAALFGATPQRLLLLAVCSAVAEELFFRAALLPLVGVFASSLIFGLLHVSARETYLGWMLWASLMGAVFAGLFLGSGTLLAPIVAHAAINYENMRYLCAFDPTEVDIRRKPAHAPRTRRL